MVASSVHWCCFTTKCRLTKWAIICAIISPCVFIGLYVYFIFIANILNLETTVAFFTFPLVICALPIFMFVFPLLWACIFNILDRIRFRVRQCCICALMCCKKGKFEERGVFWEVGEYGCWMEVHFDTLALEKGPEVQMIQPALPNALGPEVKVHPTPRA